MYSLTEELSTLRIQSLSTESLLTFIYSEIILLDLIVFSNFKTIIRESHVNSMTKIKNTKSVPYMRG